MLPDFCPEGCYWDCQHRTVEDRLRLAYAPSEATREALAEVMANPGEFVETLAPIDHHRDEIDQYIYHTRGIMDWMAQR